MKITKTTNYLIDENELKNIIADWFAKKYNKKMSSYDIRIAIRHEPYCEPTFDYVSINIEEEGE